VISLLDDFSNDLPRGSVVGSSLSDGAVRKGIDTESVLSVDNSALRIEPLLVSGWGRAGIAYGPYRRQNGLAFATFLLNGHNISRADTLPDSFRERLQQWFRGTLADPVPRRLRNWFRGPQKRYTPWLFRQWLRTARDRHQIPVLDENLSVGWFPTETPTNPLQQGNSITVHSVVPEGGELWVRHGRNSQRAMNERQDVPVYFIVVLREQGAAYYAASVPDVPGLPAFPMMRLLAIDPFADEPELFAGVHQSHIGEIGFRINSRVYRNQVASLSDYSNWFGSAHGADNLRGEGSLHLSDAETGGKWNVPDGAWSRTAAGVFASDAENIALLNPAVPSGLIHVIADCGAEIQGTVGLIWRATDDENYFCFQAGADGCELSIKENNVWFRFPAVKYPRLAPNIANSLQVSDDGETIRLFVNGQLAYSTPLRDSRFVNGTDVGFLVTGEKPSGFVLRSFEAHPRVVSIPRELKFDPPWFPSPSRVLVRDAFAGVPSDLAGRITDLGAKLWRREIGSGVFKLTGNSSVQVQASTDQPCPGRTVYTIDWDNPKSADLTVTITPPGVQRGDRSKGRAGVIFWQDPDNYITLSAFIGDFPAMSMAGFFKKDGFEELYDAVWSNVGNRMHWGVPHVLRAAFDGRRFLIFLNGEPILYRALNDIYPEWKELKINRVGILVNWEWGNDTGSIFQNFIASE
jgi:hypothetical protein